MVYTAVICNDTNDDLKEVYVVVLPHGLLHVSVSLTSRI